MTGRDAEQDVFRRPAASVNVPPQLSSLGRMNTLASWGEQLARGLLQEPLPRRWAHVQGVAARARGLAPVLGADADLIEAAAWLHDIGYAPGLAATGLHQLDGARYLRDAQHADALLCRLVAHHTRAIIEAGERGLSDVLSSEFDPAPDVLASVLTCCDMTISPDGQPVRVWAITLFGSGANSVIRLSGVEDDAFAEQGEAGAAVHLAFEHLDPVDVALDGA